MRDTKQKILDVSLELFSKKGFAAVSIRDICAKVEIKESSVYYHFKNKQAILDELFVRFEKAASDIMLRLEQSLSVQSYNPQADFFQNVCDIFFEEYLMDDFCNKVMRMLEIEQFNSYQFQAIYERWMFSKPLTFQSKVFTMLMKIGVTQTVDSDYLAIKYYAPIYMFAQRWLLCGPLDDERKDSFRANAYHHIQMFFAEIGM